MNEEEFNNLTIQFFSITNNIIFQSSKEQLKKFVELVKDVSNQILEQFKNKKENQNGD